MTGHLSKPRTGVVSALKESIDGSGGERRRPLVSKATLHFAETDAMLSRSAAQLQKIRHSRDTFFVDPLSTDAAAAFASWFACILAAGFCCVFKLCIFIGLRISTFRRTQTTFPSFWAAMKSFGGGTQTWLVFKECF